MLYFKLYILITLLKHLVVSHSYLCIWVNCWQYYQSSNNLPQSAQTLDFDLKSCFVLLNTSSHSTRCWLASISLFVVLVCLGPRVVLLVVDLASSSQSLLLWFGLLRTSSRSARCSLVPFSIFHSLCCSTPSYSAHSWLVSTVCFKLDSLCLLFNCLWRLSKNLLSSDWFLYMVSNLRQKSNFCIMQHNFSFATQLLVCNNFVCNTTSRLQHNLFLQHNFFFCNTTLFLQHNFFLQPQSTTV